MIVIGEKINASNKSVGEAIAKRDSASIADLHDIGKNIVSILLRGAGHTVKDLGNDIDTQTIVDAVKEENPEFLGLSALLTSTMAYMEGIIEALADNELRAKG
ncbi:cobalamin-dependent protein [Chloroflexota bacterium]